ncbi:hypothetical protein [Bradyrhizobium tunisiense]|jgi:hypothetical protein|uniref:hypothetical protein n=1 Tax=Bradyrhizobium tunisiense TaxID=3278709 RepID=UPI001BA487D8|nr:hypothetical protein [Bradyrhizobium diazoefficiens]MBR0812686.1 hypothetical protein [Bradyrhizobium diazoefficiens]
MHVVLIALVIGSHIAAWARGAVSMLRLSSDRRDWSMKWLSIFAMTALERFSCGKHRQLDSSRDEFNAGAQSL